LPGPRSPTRSTVAHSQCRRQLGPCRPGDVGPRRECGPVHKGAPPGADRSVGRCRTRSRPRWLINSIRTSDLHPDRRPGCRLEARSERRLWIATSRAARGTGSAERTPRSPDGMSRQHPEGALRARSRRDLLDQCSGYAGPMRAYARPPRRTASTCRSPEPQLTGHASPRTPCIRMRTQR